MSELDHHRCGHHPRRGLIAELRAEKDEQRTESLTAGVDQVPGRLRDERIVGVERVAKCLLDLVETTGDRRCQIRVDLSEVEVAHVSG